MKTTIIKVKRLKFIEDIILGIGMNVGLDYKLCIFNIWRDEIDNINSSEIFMSQEDYKMSLIDKILKYL
jgi:hypothetical protein